ncbi:unnamed protein product [Amoebophrya sp. A120]|nr:unnamed protein product [Amoebophrya sp. A120]|eukprot:GSA120T00024689001.1
MSQMLKFRTTRRRARGEDSSSAASSAGTRPSRRTEMRLYLHRINALAFAAALFDLLATETMLLKNNMWTTSGRIEDGSHNCHNMGGDETVNGNIYFFHSDGATIEGPVVASTVMSRSATSTAKISKSPPHGRLATRRSRNSSDNGRYGERRGAEYHSDLSVEPNPIQNRGHVVHHGCVFSRVLTSSFFTLIQPAHALQVKLKTSNKAASSSREKNRVFGKTVKGRVKMSEANMSGTRLPEKKITNRSEEQVAKMLDKKEEPHSSGKIGSAPGEPAKGAHSILPASMGAEYAGAFSQEPVHHASSGEILQFAAPPVGEGGAGGALPEHAASLTPTDADGGEPGPAGGGGGRTSSSSNINQPPGCMIGGSEDCGAICIVILVCILVLLIAGVTVCVLVCWCGKEVCGLRSWCGRNPEDLASIDDYTEAEDSGANSGLRTHDLHHGSYRPSEGSSNTVGGSSPRSSKTKFRESHFGTPLSAGNDPVISSESPASSDSDKPNRPSGFYNLSPTTSSQTKEQQDVSSAAKSHKKSGARGAKIKPYNDDGDDSHISAEANSSLSKRRGKNKGTSKVSKSMNASANRESKSMNASGANSSHNSGANSSHNSSDHSNSGSHAGSGVNTSGSFNKYTLNNKAGGHSTSKRQSHSTTRSGGQSVSRKDPSRSPSEHETTQQDVKHGQGTRYEQRRQRREMRKR